MAPDSSKSFFKALLITVSVLVLAGFGAVSGILIQRYIYNASPQTSLSSSEDGNKVSTAEQESISAVAEKVAPSVVSIVTKVTARSFYGTTSQEGAGTGIIVSSNGYIMTNNHVVEDASTVSVVDSSGELYEKVTVVGRDPLNDIAFLKIDSDKTFTPATLGNSATLRIGQPVVAIGNALGQYKNTVTSGIISGTGRPITAQSGSGSTETLTDLVQTDASINPGNSGGPLVNLSGQVIGINTAIVADANGIGFAIPINATKGVLAGVLENGKVNRAYMGVNYLSITPEIARDYKLPVKNGAFVYASNSNPIAADGPAAKAGLKANDIIQKINDDTIGEHHDLSSIIGQYRPGDKVKLTVLRDGKSISIDLTLGSYDQ